MESVPEEKQETKERRSTDLSNVDLLLELAGGRAGLCEDGGAVAVCARGDGSRQGTGKGRKERKVVEMRNSE